MIAPDGAIVLQVPSDNGTSVSSANPPTCSFSFLEHQHAKPLNSTPSGKIEKVDLCALVGDQP